MVDSQLARGRHRGRLGGGSGHRGRGSPVRVVRLELRGRGDGTSGLWDAPRRVVATGPYRWVRNPIYLAALLVVLGEAWLFLSPPLLVYAAAMAVFCHLFVTGYEERKLSRQFGDSYLEYRRTGPRWIPRRPAT